MVSDFNWNKYIGIPYLYGGDDPVTGLDCAGLCKLVVEDRFGIDIDTEWYYQQCPDHSDITAVSIEVAIDSCRSLTKTKGKVEEGTILTGVDVAADLAFIGIWTGRKILTSRPGRKSHLLTFETVTQLYDLYAYSVVKQHV